MSPPPSSLARSLIDRLSRPIGRRELLWAHAAAATFYVGSFFLLQQSLIVSFFCDSRHDPSGIYSKSVDVRYFSKEVTVNTALYFLYWPIHRWLMPHADVEKPFNYCDEFPTRPVYLRDVRGLP